MPDAGCRILDAGMDRILDIAYLPAARAKL